MLILSVVFFIPRIYFAQTSNKLEITSNTKAIKFNSKIDFNSVKSSRFNSTIYCVPIYSNDKSLIIYSYDFKNRTNDSIIINYKKKYKSIFKERVLSFSVLNNYLIYTCNNNIYVFEKLKENKISFIGSIKNLYNFNTTHVLDDKIFLQICYLFHPDDSPSNNTWAILNPKTLKVELLKKQSEDDAIFGAFVNSWVDVQNSKIVYSRSSEYKITFHDKNFNQIDSIVTDELNQNKKHVSEFHKRNLFSKDAISKLHRDDDSLLTRIRKIYYLNDSSLMVLLKIAGKKEIRADYWTKSNGIWKLNSQDFSSIWFIEGKEYSNTKITYSDFYQNVNSLIYIGNNHFIQPYYPFISSIITESFEINKDYYEKQNDAIKNNEHFIGFKEIKINSNN